MLINYKMVMKAISYLYLGEIYYSRETEKATHFFLAKCLAHFLA
jgi:hypothetical protein